MSRVNVEAASVAREAGFRSVADMRQHDRRANAWAEWHGAERRQAERREADNASVASWIARFERERDIQAAYAAAWEAIGHA